MKRLIIIKMGGEVLDSPPQLSRSLQAFAAVPGYKILVHGGGRIASEIGLKLGITPRFIEGRRITDAETLKVVQMVYAGLVNKNIVAELQALGCNALGLTGADANSILAVRRPAVPVDYGFAGDIREINSDLIIRIVKLGLVPVFCPLTHDGRNQFLNTNADTIASRLGMALALFFNVDMIYCFGKKGVLENEADENSAIAHITMESYQQLRQKNIIKDGMIPKLDNAFQSLAGGVQRVHIVHASDLAELIRGKSCGTTLTLS
jgi:acetylglutamate kinase